jgi:pimeloyl-ACP methyl ester carboxylesterase
VQGSEPLRVVVDGLRDRVRDPLGHRGGDDDGPLEIEPTAVLAFALADSPIWQQEYSRFFQALPFARGQQAELYATVPHRRGRIPVVFVHGTASSFGRWAEMFNRLAADSRLRSRYEFWFFSYDSGAPINFSAMLLRGALERAVKLLDPQGYRSRPAADGRDRA